MSHVTCSLRIILKVRVLQGTCFMQKLWYLRENTVLFLLEHVPPKLFETSICTMNSNNEYDITLIQKLLLRSDINRI